VSNVPTPGTAPLLALALGAMLLMRRRLAKNWQHPAAVSCDAMLPLHPSFRFILLPEKIMQLCPDCGSDFTRWIARTWWMRIVFPGSQHILCCRCDQRSLVRSPVLAAREGPLKQVSSSTRRVF